MRRSRAVTLALAMVIGLLGSLLGVSTASAQSGPPSSVTVVHGIVGVRVDVYVNGALTLPGFQPRAVAGPLSLPAGNYRVQIFGATANPPAAAPSSGAVLDQTVAVPSGATISLVAHANTQGRPTLTAFVDDISGVPVGQGRISVKHTANAGAVEAIVNNVTISAQLTNGNQANANRPISTDPYIVSFRAAGTTNVVLGPIFEPLFAPVLLNVFAVSALDGSGLTYVATRTPLGPPPYRATSSVSVVHGILGVPVDVYVGGALTLRNFQPKAVAGPLELNAGSVRVQVVAQQANPPATIAATAPSILNTLVDVPAARNVTLVAHLTAAGAPTLTAFVNDITLPPAGQTRITVRHTANAPAVDVLNTGAGNARLVQNLANGAQATLTIPAVAAPGINVGVAPTGTTSVVPGLSANGVTSAAGVLTNVYAVSSLATPTTYDLVVQTITVDRGYRVITSDGTAQAFGNASAVTATPRQANVVSAAATPSGNGWWTVTAQGVVTNYGDAAQLGPQAPISPLNAPIIRIVATPSGQGLWLLGADGGVFSYGDARFFGSTGGQRLNAPVVDMAPTPTGLGYWLVASDGGVFSYGDARFQGSTGSIKLNKPIVAIEASAGGQGYWLVASDGGVFTFGNADFLGSTGGIALVSPIVDAKASPTGRGYTLVAADGGVFNFGTLFGGSTAGSGRRAVALV